MLSGDCGDSFSYSCILWWLKGCQSLRVLHAHNHFWSQSNCIGCTTECKLMQTVRVWFGQTAITLRETLRRFANNCYLIYKYKDLPICCHQSEWVLTQGHSTQVATSWLYSGYNPIVQEGCWAEKQWLNVHFCLCRQHIYLIIQQIALLS